MSDEKAEAVNPHGGAESATVKAEIAGLNRRNSELEAQIKQLGTELAEAKAGAQGVAEPLALGLAEVKAARRELDRRRQALEAAVKENVPAAVALALVADDGDIERSMALVADYGRQIASRARHETLLAGAPRPQAGDPPGEITPEQFERMSAEARARLPQAVKARIFEAVGRRQQR